MRHPETHEPHDDKDAPIFRERVFALEAQLIAAETFKPALSAMVLT